MKQSNQCPKCGCKEIIEDATMVDRGEGNFDYDLKVATYKRPEAILFRGKQYCAVSAWVCGECGYIELYAADPRRIQLHHDATA